MIPASQSILVIGANRVLSLAGVNIVSTWVIRESQQEYFPHFEYGGVKVPYFFHHYNCGSHPTVGSERTVELALADLWLSKIASNNLVEIGAVSPYYWPGRVGCVLDPYDPHPQVTHRAQLSSIDLAGRDVLCISTLEHIGLSEYDQVADPAALTTALDQLWSQAGRIFATIPVGYNSALDKVIFSGGIPSSVKVSFLMRTPFRPYWVQVTDPSVAESQSYGSKQPIAGRGYGANAIVILERGDLLPCAAGSP